MAFAILLLAVNLRQSALAADDRSDSSRYHMAKVPPGATNGLGPWIWANKTYDRQTCRLWKDFDIPAGAKVTSACMRMTVDNAYQFSLDGRELGQGADWGGLTEYDLTLLLTPGHHVLAVNGFNDFFEAGLIMDLPIEFSDGRKLDIKSDESWRIVPNDEPAWEKLTHPHDDWPPAKAIIGKNRASEWNDRYWPFDYVCVPRFYPVVTPFWQTGWFHLLVTFVCGLILLVCVALLMQVALQSKEQRLLNLERARIARDIHDDVGTRLTKLVLQGEVAQSVQPANSEARRQLDTICDGLRGVLGAMDEMLWAVNPRHDTVENFIAYICDYTQTFLKSTKIQSVLEIESGIPPLNFDLPLRRSLLLAVKEAVNNVAKHSEASQVLLKIHRCGSKLVVIVKDNGRGFDLSQARLKRNGLTNLFQRMSDAGGECQIVTRPGDGCRVEFSITLTHYPAQHWFSSLARQPEPKSPFVELEATQPNDAKASQSTL